MRAFRIWSSTTVVTLQLLLCFEKTGVIAFDYDDESNIETGFMSKLRSFVGELGTVMNDVVSGVQKLNRGFKQVEEFLDATIDEDCQFECPKGKVPIPRRGFLPSSNGCGSFGLEDYLHDGMLPLSEFVDCCNVHDFCYATCGNDKDECDLKFKKCLYRKCHAKKDELSKLKYRGCQAGAKILYTGTTALGCKPFLKAQDESCECVRNVDEL